MIDAASSAINVPVRVIRYGVDQPLPERRELRAGPVSLVLERGDLRYVSVGGVEIIRRLYMAVRDRNWGTIEPRYAAFEVDDGGDHFEVRFSAEHVEGDVDFAWEGAIEGRADGTVICAMDGAPRRAFYRNRIGFCVLHPMDLAGVQAKVETPSGTVRGVFPECISPHQPFVDMRAISHSAGDARVTVRFEGDLFEMEDQRNWTDASYKTYGTPLRIPFPVLVKPEQRIEQKVTLIVEGASRSVGPSAVRAGIAVSIGDTPVGKSPPIGFQMASHGDALDEAQIGRLRRLKPAHLHLEADLAASNWEQRTRRGIAEATQLGAGLEVAVIADPEGARLDLLARLLASSTVHVERIFAFPAVAEHVTFPRRDLDTDRATLELVRSAFVRAGLKAPIGGGTRAYFTEFNRASDRFPLDVMDVATYSLNPQVHAFDILSLVETLAAQAETVRSAQAIAGGKPLAVGPITLRPRFNPNTTGPQPVARADELPEAVDPRQLSLLGAGWTIGSFHRLASTGAASLKYYETSGWRGLMERRKGLTHRLLFPSVPGQLFPLYHVFAALAEVAGGEQLPITLEDPLATEALAVVAGGRIMLLVANLTDQERTIEIDCPPLNEAVVRVLDETTAHEAMVDPAFFTGSRGDEVDNRLGRLRLRLNPFAVARVVAALETHGD